MRALLLLLLPFAALAAEPADVAVFEAKQNMDFPSVRIPAVLRTKQGTLLAFAEARSKAADQANNQLVQAVSRDEGKTWTKPAVICAMGTDSLNNPCVVQETKTGRLFLFFQNFPAGLHEFGALPAGPAPQGTRLWHITSDDEGKTWSKPNDLTNVLKPAEAVTTASGPGIGIQLQSGPHAGRLIMPFNSQDAQRRFVNWVAYSDDQGATWQRGANVPQEGMQLNEVQVAETGAGGLYLNSRQWRAPGPKLRKVSWSQDGGLTWSLAKDDPKLPEPVCQGSLLRVTTPKGPAILFLNPAATKRADGTLRISYDDGHTWAFSQLTFPGPFAYSSMAQLADGRIGVLYEPASNTVVRYRVVAIPTE